MGKISKVLWGILFIFLGVVLALKCFGMLTFNIFFTGWWTLFIIVPCFIGLFSESEKIGNLIGLMIGIALLLASRDIISFQLIAKLIVPVILVGIGLSILFNETIKNSITKKVKEKHSSETETIVATFAEQKIAKEKEPFESASLDAVFGSVQLDLTEAILKEESVIKASAIFGGVTIFIPKDVNIKVKSTPILGGVNHKIKNNQANTKTIYIEAFCLFGGIEIK